MPAPGTTPDYFGAFSNWALSPLPRGPVTSLSVSWGGSGYSATPEVLVTDIYGGTGFAGTATVVGGVITGISVDSGGSNYIAPLVTINDPTGSGAVATATILPPLGGPNTLTGGLKKFQEPLPALVSATPDIVSYPGSDYYEIELVEYPAQMSADMGITTLRGYRQVNSGTDTSACGNLGQPACDASYNIVAPPATASYLGPMIVATRNRPTRIKFINNLPSGTSGDLFLPVDTTVMGAGMGYDLATNTSDVYTQNRGTLHLHGGFTPWVSDGTPHQWVTPAGETGTKLTRGASTQPVPDMPLPSGGSMTFYWPNQQSSRLMFYHDHAYGMTRLNVYAGEAAGFLLRDEVEATMEGLGELPPLADNIPLVIQDKAFVWGTPPVLDPVTGSVTTPGTGTWATDPTWKWGQTEGSLWFPHVYMPNQNPWDMSGANAMGRWDYALWFWPPFTGLLANGTSPNPYYDCGPLGACTSPWEPPEIPGTPNPSIVPEAFLDTPVVNGKAYPYLEVQPKTYRFRILNACNDRFLNLQLYEADGTTVTPDGATGTEVKMVPATANPSFPPYWGTPDGREGGWPDPATVGPTMVQIGTEGGFLPAPAVLPNTPVAYNYNRRDIVVLNVQEKTLFLGPAERADVLIDFSAYRGKTIILYNDAPAPVPAFDPRNDYYTGDPDRTDTGGAPPTLPGYGPNTRTIMQIRVADAAPALALDLTNLRNALAGAFYDSQDKIIVPQASYNAAYAADGANFPQDAYARIQDTAMTFTPIGASSPITLNMEPKAIQELFELDYGRMNAILGVELPFTNNQVQTTIPYGYIDPPTEFLSPSDATPVVTEGDGTQIWKITHNGVDTHAIHFHLFNVQVINRVGWDGAIRPPDANELGWKETVRMNPLEDIIVAMRPTTPKLPFGLPDSVRLLDVTTPPGSTGQFTNIDPTGNPVIVVNQLTNFGWEYMWHCHLLGHEENDMMRPIEFNALNLLPPAPVVSYARNAGTVTLNWTDGTPAVVANLASLGDPRNEIGFRIERATVGANGTIGVYNVLPGAQPLANQTTYIDTTATLGTNYSYRVVAYNAAGVAKSNAVPPPAAANLPLPPSNAQAVLVAGPAITLTWTDNATNETGFVIERQTNTGGFATLARPAAKAGTGLVTYKDTTVKAGNSYTYRVKAVIGNLSSSTVSSNTVAVLTPAAPSNLLASGLRATNTQDTVTMYWTDNAANELNFTVQRCTGSATTCGSATATWTTLTSSLPANSVAYQNTGLARAKTYTYRVDAVNLAGPSAWSNRVTVTTP
jgi:FtsP/CotA-like multicopper oxidase with cupredoxin domain